MKSYLIIYKDTNGREVVMRQYGTSVTDAVTPIERSGTEIVSLIADAR